MTESSPPSQPDRDGPSLCLSSARAKHDGRVQARSTCEDEPPITVCGQVIEFPHYAAPHEAKYANEGRTTRDGQPCNRDCPGEWPCAERKRQRDTLRWVADVLRGSLYQRTGGSEFAEWTNPLGGTVRYGYGERGLWVVVVHGGKVCAESLDATPEWLAPHV